MRGRDDLNTEFDDLKKEKQKLDKEVADIDQEITNVDKQLTEAESSKQLPENLDAGSLIVPPNEGIINDT